MGRTSFPTLMVVRGAVLCSMRTRIDHGRVAGVSLLLNGIAFYVFVTLLFRRELWLAKRKSVWMTPLVTSVVWPNAE